MIPPTTPLRKIGISYTALAAVALTLLFLLGHAPSRTYLTAYISPYPSSAAETRSPWFSDAGYLRFDSSEGWGTVYEVRNEGMWPGGGDEYSCDAEEVEDGETVCLSVIKLLRAVHDNSEAQHRVLEQAEVGDEEDTLMRSYGELKGLRGKRLLYLGDSTDRSPIDDSGRVLPTCNWRMYEPVSGNEIGEKPNWGSQHTSRFLSLHLADSPSSSLSAIDSGFHLQDTVHRAEVRIDFLFTFGVVNTPANDAQPDDFLARIELLDPLLGPDVGYDAICLNAGLWDLEKFAREYPDLEPAAGLTSGWVKAYIDRYILVIERMREKYGEEVPIAIRLLHDLAPANTARKFTPLRVSQLRQAQLEVVRRAGVRVLPFGELMRGQPYYYTHDGAHPNAAGNMLHMETVLRFLAEA